MISYIYIYVYAKLFSRVTTSFWICIKNKQEFLLPHIHARFDFVSVLHFAYICKYNFQSRNLYPEKIFQENVQENKNWENILPKDHPISSIQFSHSVMSDSLWSHGSQHIRPRCPSPTPGVHLNSCASSWWCHPAISSSLVPFSSCPQSLPASESFPLSQLFTWGGQSTGVSASASDLPMDTPDWCPFWWTGWISLQSSGLSRVVSHTTVQKHQFFGAQPSSQSNSHPYRDHRKSHSPD